MSCGYTGRHFGAHYEDAICCDGWLWDLDSCDEPGGALCRGGDIPCPRCNTAEYIADIPVSGNAKQRRKARREMMRKVLSFVGQPKKAHQL